MDIHPLHPDDAPAVLAMAAACSPDCIRDRFFGYVAAPGPMLVRQVVDGAAAGCAFGAFAGHELVAVATGLPTAAGWEVGLLVHDEWQGRRLGTGLAHAVAAAATWSGRDLVVHVEASNGRAVRLARGLRSTGARVRVEMC